MGTSSRLGRCMKAPLRMLCRARDMYVRGLNVFADHMQHGAAVAYPAMASTNYSFPTARASAGDDDLRELIRAASLARARTLPRRAAAPAVRKSQSLAIGRIDEDKPCLSFDDDVEVGSSLAFARRSRSCVAGAKRRARSFV
ncbi:hypothetical protein C4D60_Mb09t22700 [Musa balbisiana]|uniref:Uncharacterized protein n=1 Tax=Musa balbisiana TaxID=52838 RepID=A0A4S8IJQ3_MUSBA|nr:hypothetical protein C4D60_Mb09t22700 [Musa balbisiana]